MTTRQRLTTLLLLLAIMVTACADGHSEQPQQRKAAKTNLPYQKAGLTDRQAAAHLLNRLAFGGGPGDVDRMLDFGIDKWVQMQLDGAFSDERLAKDLKKVYYLPLTTREIYDMHPHHGQVKQNAGKEGYLPKNFQTLPYPKQKKLLDSYYEKKNLKRQSGLIKFAQAHKLYLATSSDNQLREMLVDFWFNHFSVSALDSEVRPFVPTFERDTIRPFVLGSFSDMLMATAKHPAMLFYLDNIRSFAPDTVQTLSDIKSEEEMRFNKRPENEIIERRRKKRRLLQENRRKGKRSKFRGINENYARELLELHTMGVDGGYRQKDITEIARILTGWNVFHEKGSTEKIKKRMAHNRRLGFVRQSDFYFRGDHHDAYAKKALGKHFPAGRGLEEGEELLRMLAAHPSTASHISRKLAARFIDDSPPESVVKRMAKSFLNSNGNIRSVMQTLIESPEFWQSRRSKIKSPFELVASSLRAVDAKMNNPRQIQQWIFRMGQNVYGYQAPSGYPDRAEAWINTGSLLNRMKFGLSLADNRIKGIKIDLSKLNNYHEPESAEAALTTYANLLLPERDLSETIDILLPLIYDPLIDKKVSKALDKKTDVAKDLLEENPENLNLARANAEVNLAQVVGILLGSPEFQRR